MLHRECIPIEDYTDEFEIPYLAEFAETFRKYVVKSGVRSCFCLDIPIYLPGQLKPVTIMLKRKGDDFYSCQIGTEKILYEYSSPDLKNDILKGFQFTREWDDEIGEIYFYGIRINAKIFCQMDMELSFQKIVSGIYRISDNGTLKHVISDFSSIYDMCNLFDIEFDGKSFEVDLPNISTRYAMRRFFDYVQFISSIKECGS